MTENENLLDLRELINDPRGIIVSGKDRGLSARKVYCVDEYDESSGTVCVLLPEHLRIMTPSFAMGMFSESVMKFGSVDSFLEKYDFKTSDLILEQIKNAARLSLIEGDALS